MDTFEKISLVHTFPNGDEWWSVRYSSGKGFATGYRTIKKSA